MKRPSGFTLIEILVVVSIIGLLTAILLPSLNKARGEARRATCASQLRQIAVAMLAYIQDNRDRMPYASFMPSVGPAPLETDEPIYFADILTKNLVGQKDVFSCPGDYPGRTERPAPNTGMSYSQSERSSYEYRSPLAGLTPAEFHTRSHGPPWHPHEHANDRTPGYTIWFARDYDNFHGKAGQNGARRYAYIDGHISDYEN